MGEFFPNHTQFCVASVDVIAGELCALAEVLHLVMAVRTGAIGRIEPGNADAIADLQLLYVRSDCVNRSDDLMARHDGKFGKRKVSFNSMEIGMAETAAMNANANFRGSGRGIRKICEAKRRLLGQRWLSKYHGAHR